jgi:hypothetical protein
MRCHAESTLKSVSAVENLRINGERPGMSERHVAMFSNQLPPNARTERRERDEHVEMDFRLSFVVVGGFTFVIEKFVSLRRGEMSAIQLFAPAADAGAASGPLLMPLNATATLRSLCCYAATGFFTLLWGRPGVCVYVRASVFALVVALICGAAHTKHGSFLNMCRSRRRRLRRSHQGRSYLVCSSSCSYAFCNTSTFADVRLSCSTHKHRTSYRCSILLS